LAKTRGYKALSFGSPQLKIFRGSFMGSDLKYKTLSFLLYFQLIITVAIFLLMSIGLVFFDRFSSVYNYYVAVVILSVFSSAVFIYTNSVFDSEDLIEFYTESRLKYVMLLLLLSLQSLLMPFVAIFLISVMVLKRYFGQVYLCYLFGVLFFSFICYRFFIKLNSLFINRSSIFLYKLNIIIATIQVAFIIVNIFILTLL
jgi:hypothetical protein